MTPLLTARMPLGDFAHCPKGKRLMTQSGVAPPGLLVHGKAFLDEAAPLASGRPYGCDRLRVADGALTNCVKRLRSRSFFIGYLRG